MIGEPTWADWTTIDARLRSGIVVIPQDWDTGPMYRPATILGLFSPFLGIGLTWSVLWYYTLSSAQGDFDTAAYYVPGS